MGDINKLYDNIKQLAGGKIEVGTVEQFTKALGNQDTAKKIYGNLSTVLTKDQIGSENDFLSFVQPSGVLRAPKQNFGIVPSIKMDQPEETTISKTETAQPEAKQVPFQVPSLIQPEVITYPDKKTGAFTPELVAGVRGKQFPVQHDDPSVLDWAKDTAIKTGAGIVNMGVQLDGIKNKVIRKAIEYSPDAIRPFVAAMTSKDYTPDVEAAGKAYVEELSKSADTYKGKTITDLHKKGDYIGLAGKVTQDAISSLPMITMALMAPEVGLPMIGATTANEKYDSLADRKDMSENEKVTNAVTSGVISAATLWAMGASSKYLGSITESVGKVGAEQTTAALKTGLSRWVTDTYLKAGIFSEGAMMGAQSVVAKIADNSVDYATNATDTFNPMKGTGEALISGAATGLAFGGLGELMKIPAVKEAKKNFDTSESGLISVLVEKGLTDAEVTGVLRTIKNVDPTLRPDLVNKILEKIPEKNTEIVDFNSGETNQNVSLKSTPLQSSIENYFGALDNLKQTSSKYYFDSEKEKQQFNNEINKAGENAQAGPRNEYANKFGIDEVSAEKAQAEQQLVDLSNKTTGTIQTVKLKDNSEIQIANGTPIFKEDGTFDAENTGIITHNPKDENGNPVLNEDGTPKILVVDPNSIMSLVSETPVQEAQAEAGSQIDQAVISNQIDNFYPKDVEDYNTEDGIWRISVNETTGKLEKQMIEVNENAKDEQGRPIVYEIDDPINITDEEYSQLSGKPIPNKSREDHIVEVNDMVQDGGSTTEPAPVYPAKKDGTVDFEAMNDEQVFNYTKETKGEEAAQALIGRHVTRLQAQIQENTRATNKLKEETNKLLAKAKTPQEELSIEAKQEAKGQALKEEYTALNSKLGELQSFLPKVEAPAPVEAPKVVNTRPEILQLRREQEQAQANLDSSETLTPNLDTSTEVLQPNVDTSNEVQGKPVIEQSSVTKPKETPFQKRAKALGEYIDMKDYILRIIAGGQKIKWKGGLESEFRGSNAERLQRRNYIDETNGLTPTELAHQIWNDYGENGNNGEIPGVYNMSDGEILDEVHEVLRTVKSNSDALSQAEERRTIGTYDPTPEEAQIIDTFDDEMFAAVLGITNFTPEQITTLNDFISGWSEYIQYEQNSINTGTMPTSESNSTEGNAISEEGSRTTEVTPRNVESVFVQKLKDKFPNGLKLYHRTSKENWDKIQVDGFIKASDDVNAGVYTVLEDKTIDRIGGVDNVLLQINVPVSEYEGLYPEEGTYYEDPENVGWDGDYTSLMFKNYMDEHPDLIGGDIIYSGDVPISMIKVEKPTEQKGTEGTSPETSPEINAQSESISENEGQTERVVSKEEQFNLTPAKDFEQFETNINWFLKNYGSREMAAIQVELYLNEKPEFGKEYIAKHGITTTDELKIHLGKLQAKLRAGKGNERKAVRSEISKEKTERNVDEVIKLALEAEAEMQEAIRQSDLKGNSTEQKGTKENSSVLSPIKNGSIATYKGKQYTINGITSDGKFVDLEGGGETIEDIPVEEVSAYVNVPMLRGSDGQESVSSLASEPIKVTLFKKGEGGTKGIFQDSEGNLYKSLHPTELKQIDGVYQRVPLETTTDEYNLLSELQDNPNIPKIGKEVETSEGKAFEIEKLDEVGKLSLGDYAQISKILDELNAKGYHVGDKVTAMKRPSTGEFVIVDFSNGYKGDRGSVDSRDYMSGVKELLSKKDLYELQVMRSASADRDMALNFDDKPTEYKYRLTQRPPSIGTHPTEGIVGNPVQDGREWILNYSKPLSLQDVYSYELTPIMDDYTYMGKIVNGILNKSYRIKSIDKDFVTLETLNSEGKKVDKEIGIREFFKQLKDGNYTLSEPDLETLQQSDKTKLSETNNEQPDNQKIAKTETVESLPKSKPSEKVGEQKSTKLLDTLTGGEYSKSKGKEQVKFQTVREENKRIDEQYFNAIERGDMDTAQRIVDQQAANNGYISKDEYKLSHRAPSVDTTPSAEKMDIGGDFSLTEIANGYSSQPLDYFSPQGARWYGYDYLSGRQSQSAINSAIRAIKSGGNPTITIYRAVEKSLKEGSVRNGDWITLSEQYAKEHGQQHIDGSYKIISQEVPASNVWWDGNDINEWGYDDGKSYTHKNTKNNKKLADAIVRDDNGDIIPPSKRFNQRVYDPRFHTGSTMNQSTPEEVLQLTERLLSTGLAKEVKMVTPEEMTAVLEGNEQLQVVSDNVFYSPTEKALNSISQEKGTKDQFKAMLLKNGAKQAELDWMGFDELPEKLTKADIQQWIDENRIVVKEVELGEKHTKVYSELSKEDAYYNLMSGIEVFDENGNKYTQDELAQSKNSKYFAYNNNVEGTPTKFSSYVLPGGENYKELLLTMNGEYANYNAFISNKYGDQWINKITPEESAKKTELFNKPEGIFNSSHYDEANILAHIRFDERTVNGEKVLFIEEFQSDWAQKGKKEGFDDGKVQEERNILNEKRRKLEQEADSLTIRTKVANTGRVTDYELSYKDDARVEAIKNELRDIDNQLIELPKAGIVPDMPFKKTDQWVNLAARRMMRYAAENGFDRIAWTNGEQQADRYDLRKQVDELDYNDSTNQLIGKKDGSVVINTSATKDSLPNIIGKDAAKNLLDTPIEKDVIGNAISYGIKGEQLKFGGEGMKAFYDGIVPSAMSKLGKPFGAKVENVSIFTNEADIQEAMQNGADWEDIVENRTTQQSIPVTDSMKETAMKGMPLFMRKPDGTIYGFVKDGVVYLNSEKPNLNTPIHEFGHLFTPIIKSEHPEFYQKGVELIKESPYYDQVKNDPNYSNLDEDGIIDEAMNQAIGDKGEKVVEKGLFERLKEWINGVWERIGAKFGIKNLTSEQIEKLTLNDWTDVVNSELLNGEKLSNTKNSIFAEKTLKEKQLDIINESNPMLDDYHTGIRSVADIKTLEEAISDPEWDYDEYNPDYTKSMAQKAIKTGKVTVYSSNPIKQGVFVSPSKMEAESYSGNGKVYAKEVNTSDVAWIDPTQGQYAEVKEKQLPTTIDVDGIQRPTTNSTGKPIHSTEEGVRNFWKWFGDSKVIDESGRPLVVYHGGASKVAKFDTEKAGTVKYSDWGNGIYFTPSEGYADMYRADYAKSSDKIANRLYNEYVEVAKSFGTTPMDKSIDLSNETEKLNHLKKLENKWRDRLDKIKNTRGEVYTVYLNISNPLRYRYEGMTDPYLSQTAKDGGNDGIIVTPMTEYVVFSPTQIKSATGNNGSFSENNANFVEEKQIAYDNEQEAIQKTIDFVSSERPTRIPLDNSRGYAEIHKRSVIEGFKESGYVDFVGRKINSIDDVVDMWNIHRSPYIEKSHIIFVKDGSIVGTTATTLNKAGITAFGKVEDIETLYNKFGADGMYLLHNHPSGNHKPSSGDIQTTQKIKDLLPEVNLIGHIVIDHDKYSYIDPTKDGYKEFEQKNAPAKLFYERELVGNNPQKRLFEISKALLNGEGLKGAIIYLSPKLDINAYDVFPEGATQETIAELTKQGLKNNLGQVAIITHDGTFDKDWKVPANVVDVIDTKTGYSTNFKNEKSDVITSDDVLKLWEPTTNYPKPQPPVFTSADTLVDQARKIRDHEEALQRWQERQIVNLATQNGERLSPATISKLNKDINSVTSKLWEGWADAALPIKEFQKFLEKNGVPISDNDNYYMRLTTVPSRIEYRFNQFKEDTMKPFIATLKAIEKNGFTYDDITTYAKLKHGPEYTANILVREYTNKIEAERAKIEDVTGSKDWTTKNQKLDQKIIDFKSTIFDYIEQQGIDYAGRDAIIKRTGESNLYTIKNFEDKNGSLVDDFWKQSKEVSHYALDEEFRGGMRTKESAEAIKGMFDYYVPLKGHREPTAETTWDYSMEHGDFFFSAVKKGKGRTSESDDPFSIMESTVRSAIGAAEQNLQLQSIRRLALKDTTGSMTVSKTWFVKVGEDENGNPEFKVADEVPFEDTDTNETYNDKVAKFEAKMKDLKSKGEAYQGGSERLKLGLWIKPTNEREHEVVVKSNGESYTIRFHTSPRVPQAINGTNMRYWGDDFAGKLMSNVISPATRAMAAYKTLWRPTFILITNPLRDIHAGLNLAYIDEGAKFTGNVILNFRHAQAALLRRSLNQHWDKNDAGKQFISGKYDKMLNDYMMLGGKTGISKIMELKDIQENIQKQMKSGINPVGMVFDFYHAISDITENQMRFAVYVTAIEKGYSKLKATSMAKEATVNFDRKGNGRNGLRELKATTAFVNVGFQALDNIYSKSTKNTETFKRFLIAVAANALSGALVVSALSAAVCALFGYAEDKWAEDFAKLSSFERNSNFLIWTPWGIIKIPLGQEFRMYHGFGMDLMMMAHGKVSGTETAINMIKGLSSLLPYNPIESMVTRGTTNPISALVGTADFLNPLSELSENKNWLGYSIYKLNQDEAAPGYTKIKTNKKGEPYAPELIIKFSKSLDSMTGGDGAKAGLISPNPDIVDHLLGGYFSGIYEQPLALAQGLLSEKEGSFIKELTPRAIWKEDSEIQSRDTGLNEKYYDAKDEAVKADKLVGRYEKAIELLDKNNPDYETLKKEYQSKIDKLQTDDLYNIQGTQKTISALEKSLDEISPKEQVKTEKEISELKKNIVKINNGEKVDPKNYTEYISEYYGTVKKIEEYKAKRVLGGEKDAELEKISGKLYASPGKMKSIHSVINILEKDTKKNPSNREKNEAQIITLIKNL